MPTSEPALRQWDVVVLPFPYADRLAEKRRPGVIVSKESLARDHGIAWIAMITSAENAGWPCDIPLIADAENGLNAPSVIRPWKLATVDVSRILRIAGRIGRDDAERLSKALVQTI